MGYKNQNSSILTSPRSEYQQGAVQQACWDGPFGLTNGIMGYVFVIIGLIFCWIYGWAERPVGWYAEVCVEVDPVQVIERNAPYKTTDKFYTYTPGWLQTFLSEKQQAAEQ